MYKSLGAQILIRIALAEKCFMSARRIPVIIAGSRCWGVAMACGRSRAQNVVGAASPAGRAWQTADCARSRWRGGRSVRHCCLGMRTEAGEVDEEGGK